MKKRPVLHEVPLSTVWPPQKAEVYITIDVGAWDDLIENSYNTGFVLLEMDANETPIKAFKKISD